MLPLFLNTMINEIGQRLQNAEPFTWVADEPTEDDMNHILEQGAPSEFDTLGLRSRMISDLKSKKASIVCKSGPYAKVLAIVYPDTQIPWKIFSSIFQAFGRPKGLGHKGRPKGLGHKGRPKDLGHKGRPKDFSPKGSGPKGRPKPWRIVWFANPSPRLVPTNHLQGEAPGPEHVNGGYTYPCQPDTVVIYREEEVCRVLIHELLHAACTDDMSKSEEEREALTESWAELFLIAVKSRGNPREAARLWRIQSHWIADQEALLSRNVKGPADYAWRYTIGRRGILESWGFTLPPPSGAVITSLRFTAKEL